MPSVLLFPSVLLTRTNMLLGVPVALFSEVCTPLTYVYKQYLSMKYTSVFVWTYDYSLFGRRLRDLVKMNHAGIKVMPQHS